MRALTDREALHIALEIMLDSQIDEFERVTTRIEGGHLPTIEEWDHCIDGDREALREGASDVDPLAEEEEEQSDERPDGCDSEF